MISSMARAYIYLNRSCNLSCVFCASDDTNKGLSDYQTAEYFDAFLELTAAKYDSIVISGGEPTLHPCLPQIIENSSKLFKNIQLMTNGLRFSDGEYLQLIINSGITDICIPVTSPTPEINDALVGCKNTALIQTRGINNLLSIDRNIRPKVHIKTVVMNGVLESFRGFRDYLDVLPDSPNFFIINGLHIGSKVLSNPHLIPDYAISGQYISELIISLRNLPMTIAVAEFPLCLLSVQAIDVLANTGFPISAAGVESMVFDSGKLLYRKGLHVKAERCFSRCIANDLCDGFSAKNFDVIRDRVLNLLHPMISG